MTAQTFVVPLDGSEYSERALPIARALAERVDGRLLLVSVMERGPLNPGWYLDEIVDREQLSDVDTVPVADRYAADAIVTIVGESADRIVCMTSHGRGGLRWGVVGSVAEEVVRRADRPTLLVGRHCREDFLTGAPHLLACVDGSESSARLAPAASEWADRLGLDLHAAIVVHPLDIESAEHAEKLLGSIAEQLGGPDRVAANVLTSRYPEGALVDYADDLPAAIIAMNCHGRTGLARVALGSTTMGVLQKALCPLLVVSAWSAKG
jgi:nucleotide-binding universal stress UspA family protein